MGQSYFLDQYGTPDQNDGNNGILWSLAFGFARKKHGSNGKQEIASTMVQKNLIIFLIFNWSLN